MHRLLFDRVGVVPVQKASKVEPSTQGRVRGGHVVKSVAFSGCDFDEE